MKQLCLAFVLVTASACNLGGGDFAGKGCENANDCPLPYVCALARPGQGRTCEMLRLPLHTDAGTPPAGPLSDYCHNAKAVLDKTCVRNCHGADTTGSLQTSFRLDQYDDNGAVLGAMNKAARIRVRTADTLNPMPPTTAAVQPTAAERAVLVKWVDDGALNCVDGGM